MIKGVYHETDLAYFDYLTFTKRLRRKKYKINYSK
jgi:hypothetical protein